MENVTYCKIDSNLRKITLPGNEKILGVYHDKNVTRKHFQMPRYYQDNDMSEFSIKVNYVNEDKETDCYAVDDLAVTDEDYITFSWLVGATACRVPGMVGFVICFTKVDHESNITQEYNTELAVGKVLDGCEFGEVTNDKTEKDIIAQFRLSLQQLKDEQDKVVKEIGTSIDALNRKFEDKCTEVDGLLDTKASTKDVIVNLLPKKAASTFTNMGVTIKNDNEGVYTVSGTAEQNVIFGLGGWIIPKKFKTKLLGAPTGSSIDTYYIDSSSGNAYAEGLILEPNKMIGVPHIVIKEGVTLNNVKFKPMLTACLDATYDDYVPNVASSYTATTFSKVFSEFVNATQKTENDLKKSVSDGKTLLAEAITEKGIDTASTASFSTMAKNVKKIQTAGYGVSGYIDTTISANGEIMAIYGLYTVEEQEAS